MGYVVELRGLGLLPFRGGFGETRDPRDGSLLVYPRSGEKNRRLRVKESSQVKVA